MAELSKPARDVLRMIVDLGSGYLKVAAQISRNGQPFEEIAPERIPLKAGTGRYELEQVLVIDGETLICGESEVKKWEARNPDQHHRVIESPKLCLCRKYRDSPTARRVWTALGAKPGDLTAIQNLFADQLEWCRQTVFAHYRTDHTSSIHPRTDWDNVGVETIITVPCNWDDEARGIIRNAAYQASVHDYDKINIAYEPVCAAASDMEAMRKANDIQYGDKVLFMDLGKSTVDLSPVEMRERANSEPQSQFHLAGKPFGDDAGAQDVNEAAWLYIQSHSSVLDFGGNLDGTRDRLGNLDESDFYRRFNNTFERVKRHFQNDEDYHITISARHGWQHRRDVQGRPCQAVFLITLSRDEMERLYRAWLERLVQITAQYLEREDHNECRIVMLTGMSRGNEYVTEYLHKAIAKFGRVMYISKSDSPVTMGGLLQYPKHATACRPTGFFYATRSEIWQPSLPEHRDATHFSAQSVRKRGLTRQKPKWEAHPKSEVSVVDEFSGETELLDRLAKLMSILPGTAPIARAVPMVFNVDAGSPARLTFCIYQSFVEQPEHSPLRAPNGSVDPCFARWPLQFVDIPDSQSLRNIGFVAQQGSDNTSYFVLSGIVEMWAGQDRLEVRLRLLKPGTEFQYDKQAARRGLNDELLPVKNNSIFFDQTRELWHEDRAHTVLNGHGQHTLPTGSTAIVPLPPPVPSRRRQRKSQKRGLSTSQRSSKRNLTYWDGDCDDEEVLPRRSEVKRKKSSPSLARRPITLTLSSTRTPRVLTSKTQGTTATSPNVAGSTATRLSRGRSSRLTTPPGEESSPPANRSNNSPNRDFEAAERLRIMGTLGLPPTTDVDKVVSVWRMLGLGRDPSSIQEMKERAVSYMAQEIERLPAYDGEPGLMLSPKGNAGPGHRDVNGAHN
ncbi:hypothetical protein LTR56_003443 [Elasticomyces elasticus]|nr:hypothetical protein LTR22_010919 [Elasticomyces elasticus]KAK3655437.1 hypothetical protein LTR56_003443 [Elasticomyces elasticus]KAK4919926.1 hypothetical protein LTR49_012524 [Elasticomyces elasticus]KAK5756693.1 hypothetical protein LTS12_013156 [Elasticomyces elasticus]